LNPGRRFSIRERPGPRAGPRFGDAPAPVPRHPMPNSRPQEIRNPFSALESTGDRRKPTETELDRFREAGVRRSVGAPPFTTE
jgi:hypothetical protein